MHPPLRHDTPRHATRRLAAALLLALPCAAALAAYPDKPIRLVVPFPAGGSTDLVARAVAQEMSRTLGQTVNVDNRAGAGSVVGSEMVAKSAADGYTLLLAGSSNVYMPYLHKKLAFRPIEDFAGIGLVADIPNLFAVNADTPYRSVADVVKAAKAKPGEITYASAGVGTPAHLVCELMAARSGVKLSHVPYKGNAPAVSDLMGGQVPTMCNNLAGTLPYVKGNSKIRILAVTGSARSPAAPDVPTFAEAGVQGLESGVWMALVAPAATPPAIVATLSDALTKALQAAPVKERFASFGAAPLTGTPAAYLARVKQDTEVWAPVLKQLDLKAE
jgi:tripartite-type tricarboxylate transporter receptor subunit TctC